MDEVSARASVSVVSWHTGERKNTFTQLFFMSLSDLLYTSACSLAFFFHFYLVFNSMGASSSRCCATKNECVAINQSIECMGDPCMRGREALCSFVITEAI